MPTSLRNCLVYDLNIIEIILKSLQIGVFWNQYWKNTSFDNLLIAAALSLFIFK